MRLFDPLSLSRVADALERLSQLYEIDLYHRGALKGKIVPKEKDESWVGYGVEREDPEVAKIYYEVDGRKVESLPGPLDKNGRPWS